MQKVLVCSTSSPTMKAEIWGWSDHDPRSIALASAKYPKYASSIWHDHTHVWRINDGITSHARPITPLHALALGWKLLAPPTESGTLSSGETEYEWWFVRD